jgi:hypothetical protein
MPNLSREQVMAAYWDAIGRLKSYEPGTMFPLDADARDIITLCGLCWQKWLRTNGAVHLSEVAVASPPVLHAAGPLISPRAPTRGLLRYASPYFSREEQVLQIQHMLRFQGAISYSEATTIAAVASGGTVKARSAITYARAFPRFKPLTIELFRMVMTLSHYCVSKCEGRLTVGYDSAWDKVRTLLSLRSTD